MIDLLALRPSSAHRWMQCPGSVGRSANEDSARPDTSAAAHGTAEHEAAARLLLAPDGDHTSDGDDDISVLDYVRAVREQARAGRLWVETRVHIPVLPGKNISGTADAIVLTADGRLQIHDKKYRWGRYVEVVDNAQLMCYALGAQRLVALLYGSAPETVELHVHQDTVRSHTATALELRDFAFRLRLAAERALAPNAELVPGEDACWYCPAKVNCPALRAVIMAASAHIPDAATDIELGQLRQISAIAARWASEVNDAVHAKLVAGTPVPGWTLVAGRMGNRRWAVDDDMVVADLLAQGAAADDLYRRDLKSPAKISAGQRKLDISSLVTRTPGRLIVVADTQYCVAADEAPTVPNDNITKN